MSTITQERQMAARERVEASIAAHAQAILASAPPLTADQRAEIAAILSRPVR